MSSLVQERECNHHLLMVNLLHLSLSFLFVHSSLFSIVHLSPTKIDDFLQLFSMLVCIKIYAKATPTSWPNQFEKLPEPPLTQMLH